MYHHYSITFNQYWYKYIFISCLHILINIEKHVLVCWRWRASRLLDGYGEIIYRFGRMIWSQRALELLTWSIMMWGLVRITVGELLNECYHAIGCFFSLLLLHFTNHFLLIYVINFLPIFVIKHVYCLSN